MSAGNTTFRHPSDVLLTPLSETEWRVSDSRVPWDSRFSLIGFIESVNGTFEVLEFGDPMQIFVVSSMDSALEKFAPPVFHAAPEPIDDEPLLDERLERVLPLWARGQLRHVS
ncbi:hypothetical protein AB4Y63_09740 [Leifsonia sp. YAF41]|uniref:hypothetical protein n=1 Tax=Leifsonia sp. YAF41 TaxID=3233086 RepID=UPI003F947BCB